MRTLRRLRRHFVNWLPIALDVGLLRRPPNRIRVRAPGLPILGKPARFGMLYSLAYALDLGWRVEPDLDGKVTLIPQPDVRLRVRWDHGYDVENALEVFADRVYSANLAGGTVVDLGASIGDSTVFFAASGAVHVEAFEPNPESFALARDNISRSRYAARITMHRAAVGGAHSGNVLRFPRGIPNASSLDPSPQATNRWSFDDAVETPVLALDELVAGLHASRISLLKIDVQGAEYALLESSSVETLSRIDCVILEFTNGPQELPRLLRAAGFGSVRVDNGVRGYIQAMR